MKVLLCLCACIATSSAGIIGYPVAPLAYHKYIIDYPFTTIAKPLGVPFAGVHGFPLPLGPSYYSIDVIPQNVIFPGVPGVFHYLPIAPTDGKGNPDKKKPGDKKDKDSKEETTEESKKEESTTSSGSETEELAQ